MTSLRGPTRSQRLDVSPEDRPPAHNVEAEQAVLGALLLCVPAREDALLTETLGALGLGDFYLERHKRIVAAIGALHREGRRPDLVSVTDRLRERGQLDEVGGPSYVTGLMDATFSPLTLAEHLPILKRDAARRALVELGGHLLQARNGQDLEALVTLAGRVLDDVRDIHSFHPDPKREVVNESITGEALAADEATVEIEWLPFLRQAGVLAGGCATLVSGHGKAGKTTLLLHAARSLVRSPAFRVCWLTEEPRDLWASRVRHFAELATPNLTLIFAAGTAWPRMLSNLETEEADLVIVDTIRAFCGIADENDQAAVTAAIQPLIFLARRHRWALVLVHHLRKSAADAGLGHAGSHALVGLVDVAVELHRDPHARTRRICKAVSRFPETPAEWALDLRGDDLQALGDPSLLAAAETVRRVAAVLDETPRTRKEIAALLEPVPSGGALHQALTALTSDRKATRQGRGTKGDPQRWSAPKHSFIHDLSPIRERIESESADEGDPRA